jgi:hypothetical protein
MYVCCRSPNEFLQVVPTGEGRGGEGGGGRRGGRKEEGRTWERVIRGGMGGWRWVVK